MRPAGDRNGPLARLNAFIHHESTAGLILVAAALAAIAIYNIPGLRTAYDNLLNLPAAVSLGDIGLSKTLRHWIDDGLMAVFFFLVGLEIKRELREGNPASLGQVALPAIAAAGGMLAPALIYVAFNWGDRELLRGWAIPTATDIAFALGALSIAGSRVPPALKVFLLTLATFDDLGAIVIIALFYTASLSLASLVGAAVCLGVLIAMNLLKVGRTAPYVAVGVALWAFVLKSGVHATLSGVALAMTIPLYRKDGTPMLAAIEEALHPYVKFAVLPLFAFANAGIPLAGFSLGKLLASLPLGIIAGLVVGKPVGVLIAAVAAIALGFAKLPEGTSWRQMMAASCLAGIGFTMSLFIGGLAFTSPELENQLRAGVILGSIISTALGIGLMFSIRRAD